MHAHQRFRSCRRLLYDVKLHAPLEDLCHARKEEILASEWRQRELWHTLVLESL